MVLHAHKNQLFKDGWCTALAQEITKKEHLNLWIHLDLHTCTIHDMHTRSWWQVCIQKFLQESMHTCTPLIHTCMHTHTSVLTCNTWMCTLTVMYVCILQYWIHVRLYCMQTTCAHIICMYVEARATLFAELTLIWFKSFTSLSPYWNNGSHPTYFLSVTFRIYE